MILIATNINIKECNYRYVREFMNLFYTKHFYNDNYGMSQLDWGVFCVKTLETDCDI